MPTTSVVIVFVRLEVYQLFPEFAARPYHKGLGAWRVHVLRLSQATGTL